MHIVLGCKAKIVSTSYDMLYCKLRIKIVILWIYIGTLATERIRGGYTAPTVKLYLCMRDFFFPMN